MGRGQGRWALETVDQSPRGIKEGISGLPVPKLPERFGIRLPGWGESRRLKRESLACLYQGSRNGRGLVATSGMSPGCKGGSLGLPVPRSPKQLGLATLCGVSPGSKMGIPGLPVPGSPKRVGLVALSGMSPGCKEGDSLACLYQGPQNWVLPGLLQRACQLWESASGCVRFFSEVAAGPGIRDVSRKSAQEPANCWALGAARSRVRAHSHGALVDGCLRWKALRLFPRFAWECLPGRSAALVTRSVTGCIPTQSVGTIRRSEC